MHDFALVTEGPTDHGILKNVLIGFFKDQREPDIHREHPDPQAEKQYGGWTLVLQYLRQKKFQQAFQLNQFLIVQVDTDVCEESGFDVPRQDAHGPLELTDFVAKVVGRLKVEIGADDFAIYGDRFVFAIGVDQLECWVLPLWYNGSKGEQTVHCVERLGGCSQLRDALDRKNYQWIRKEKKDPLSYEVASRGYRNTGVLHSQGPRSPSLAIFLEELKRRSIVLQPID